MIKKFICKVWGCTFWVWKDMNNEWKAKQWLPKCPRCGKKLDQYYKRCLKYSS